MNVKLNHSQKIRVSCSEDVYGVVRAILLRENRISRKKERFWVIGLASDNHIEYIELIALGSLTGVAVKPMEVFSWALQKKSAKIILAHNHPSGALLPSEADKDLTDHLYQAGKFLKIPVLDHLIVTETGYYSFLDSGLLDELSRSGKYVPRFLEEARIKKEARALGEEKGIEKGIEKKSREIAREMKREGYDPATIARLTGLSESQLKRLK